MIIGMMKARIRHIIGRQGKQAATLPLKFGFDAVRGGGEPNR
jgi:hypothetical protein